MQKKRPGKQTAGEDPKGGRERSLLERKGGGGRGGKKRCGTIFHERKRTCGGYLRLINALKGRPALQKESPVSDEGIERRADTPSNRWGGETFNLLRGRKKEISTTKRKDGGPLREWGMKDHVGKTTAGGGVVFTLPKKKAPLSRRKNLAISSVGMDERL